jgi:NodT family efflux transporter outer membrane factor (OMF) lipoprotein
MRTRGVAVRAAALCGCVALSCSLKKPPGTGEVVDDALPSTTRVRGDWTAPAGDTGKVDDGWIKNFNDPQLWALVEEAVSVQNPNMRLLSSQIDRAAASAELAGSALKPTVGLAGDLSGTAGDDAVSGGSAGLGLVISWEADVWGKVRAGAAAADENLRATVADFEYARQSLAAQTTKTWFLATELQLQVELARETVDLLTELLRLVETKFNVGQVSMQDVYLTRADLSSAQEALRQAISGQKAVQRALEILLGRYPSAEVETASELMPVPPPIPVGIPSNIIARRPDLVAAERRVAAAFYLTEQARLAKLPSFNLTAGVGGSTGLDDAIVDLGAGIFAPIFTGGALEAQVEQATADQEAAIAVYGQTLLRAFEEVETSLTNEALYQEREEYLQAVVDDSRRAYELSRIQYDVGQIDLLSVLLMQTKWIGARVGLIHVKNERLEQRVNLHLALGGSFDERAPKDETDDSTGPER